MVLQDVFSNHFCSCLLLSSAESKPYPSGLGIIESFELEKAYEGHLVQLFWNEKVLLLTLQGFFNPIFFLLSLFPPKWEVCLNMVLLSCSHPKKQMLLQPTEFVSSFMTCSSSFFRLTKYTGDQTRQLNCLSWFKHCAWASFSSQALVNKISHLINNCLFHKGWWQNFSVALMWKKALPAKQSYLVQNSKTFLACPRGWDFVDI